MKSRAMAAHAQPSKVQPPDENAMAGPSVTVGREAER